MFVEKFNIDNFNVKEKKKISIDFQQRWLYNIYNLYISYFLMNIHA